MHVYIFYELIIHKVYIYIYICISLRTLEFTSREAFANFLSFIETRVKELELLVPVNMETAFDPPRIKSFQFGPFVNEIVPLRNYESRSLRKVFEVCGGVSPRATLRVK